MNEIAAYALIAISTAAFVATWVWAIIREKVRRKKG